MTAAARRASPSAGECGHNAGKKPSADGCGRRWLARGHYAACRSAFIREWPGERLGSPAGSASRYVGVTGGARDRAVFPEGTPSCSSTHPLAAITGAAPGADRIRKKREKRQLRAHPFRRLSRISTLGHVTYLVRKVKDLLSLPGPVPKLRHEDGSRTSLYLQPHPHISLPRSHA